MKKNPKKSISLFLWTIIIFSNLYKFLLINAGFLTEPDERRYLMSFSFLKNLSKGHFSEALRAIYNADGRPGSIILHSIPASLQFILAKIRHLEVFETKSFQIVFIYNFIILLLTLYVLYKIFHKLFQSRIISLSGILIYSLLVNNFIYLRHIYPYNESLLIFLWLTYQILKSSNFKLKKIFFWGALAFFGFTVYPAYNLSFFAVYFLYNFILFFQRKSLKQWLKYNVIYILGSVSVLVAFEVFSKISGTSYIGHLRTLSKTVNQGSFDESYSFITKYFIEIEQVTGIILLFGLLIFLFFLPKLLSKKSSNDRLIVYLVISFTIPYLMFATSGYFFHKSVMMGRVLHQFIFIIILINLWLLQQILITKQQLLILTISIMAVVQFFLRIHDYLKISYPRDVYWQFLKTYPLDKIKNISEYDNSWSNLPQKIDSIYIEKNTKDTVIIINGMYFFPFDNAHKYHAYQVRKNQKYIFDKPHFINWKAYQYEGYGKQERQLIDSLKLHIKVLNPDNS